MHDEHDHLLLLSHLDHRGLLITQSLVGVVAMYSFVHVLNAAATNPESCYHAQSIFPVESPGQAEP